MRVFGKEIFDKESKAEGYREFFLDFLFLEIPNLVQIFTLVFVLNFLAKDISTSITISSFVLLLFVAYFITKQSHYIWDQISNQNSLFNARKLDPKTALSSRYGIWYTLAITLVLALIQVVLLTAVKLQPIFESIRVLEDSVEKHSQ